ncbi:MAG: DinB family protein [Bryobacterales bacterium]|nr:DinB family protein [Bryobacterales bacterium]
MTRAEAAEARALESWQDYQAALVRAIAPLTAGQMAQRPLPGRRSPGEIAAHIVFGRALHLSRALGDAAPGELQPLLAWDDENAPRTVAEIMHGLDLTWRIIAGTLMQGQPADPAFPAAQAIWGLLDHDLPHAGQLSLLLRANGLPGVEI